MNLPPSFHHPLRSPRPLAPLKNKPFSHKILLFHLHTWSLPNLIAAAGKGLEGVRLLRDSRSTMYQLQALP